MVGVFLYVRCTFVNVYIADRPETPYVFQYSESPPPPMNVIYDASQPNLEMSQLMMDIFAPHRRQLGLEVDIAQIRDSLSLPMLEQHHSVLLNAIYLWACFLSRPGPMAQSEGHYLKVTLGSLNDALQQPDKITDTIQASCLLSYSIVRDQADPDRRPFAGPRIDHQASVPRKCMSRRRERDGRSHPTRCGL
jgi:hypothetical protein